MGEIELHKAIITRGYADLYSKNKRRKQQAVDWLLSGVVNPEITVEECCDLSGTNITDVKRITNSILEGKLSKSEYAKAIEDSQDNSEEEVEYD